MLFNLFPRAVAQSPSFMQNSPHAHDVNIRTNCGWNVTDDLTWGIDFVYDII